MTDQEKNIQMSALDIFASTQETFEEAKKKSSEESKSRATYLRIKNDGTYNIRILPLAPVVNAEGEVLPMERKGYEYPLRSLMLKIVEPQTDSKGKPKINYVSVCNATHAFKDKLKSDLIDTYVNRVCEVHADDAALCKKLREGSFNGGLRWDSKRCMYVIDVDNPGDGIQILQLSYAQYKDLEERKLNVWNKLNKGGKNVPCPISSISNAYPVEIIRKTENGKASYSFNIDTLSGINALDEDACQKLLDKPRLPEVLYRYTRYHLEATIAYLTQLDEQHDIDMVMMKRFRTASSRLNVCFLLTTSLISSWAVARVARIPKAATLLQTLTLCGISTTALMRLVLMTSQQRVRNSVLLSRSILMPTSLAFVSVTPSLISTFFRKSKMRLQKAKVQRRQTMLL